MSGYAINGRTANQKDWTVLRDYLNAVAKMRGLPQIDAREIKKTDVLKYFDANGDKVIDYWDYKKMPAANFGAVDDVLCRHGVREACTAAADKKKENEEYERNVSCSYGDEQDCSKAMIRDNLENFERFLQRYKSPAELVSRVMSGKYVDDYKNATEVFHHSSVSKMLEKKVYDAQDYIFKNPKTVEKMGDRALLFFGHYLARKNRHSSSGALQYLVVREVMARYMKKEENRRLLERSAEFFSNANIEIAEIGGALRRKLIIKNKGYSQIIEVKTSHELEPLNTKLKITTKNGGVVEAWPYFRYFPDLEVPFDTYYIMHKGEKYLIPTDAVKWIKRFLKTELCMSRFLARSSAPAPEGCQNDLPKYKAVNFKYCAFDTLWYDTVRQLRVGALAVKTAGRK